MPPIAPQYELDLGGRVVVLREGETARAVTPGGEAVAVTLRRRPIQSYADELVAFDYDASFALEADDERDEEIEDWVVRVIEGIGGAGAGGAGDGGGEGSALFTVQIFPERVPPGAALDGALVSLRDTLAGAGAKARDRTVETQRFVAGAERVGRRLAWSVGREASATDFFAFDLGPRTVVVAFERADADAEDADRKFDLVARSLRAATPGA